MSTGNKSLTVPSKKSRPQVSRHFVVERLEPRTVLSSIHVVTIIIEPGMYSGNPPPPAPEPLFHDAAPFGWSTPPVAAPDLPPSSLFFISWPLFNEFAGAGGVDQPPPRPEMAWLASGLAPPPPSDLGDAKARDPHPEGETGHPDRLNSPAAYADLVPPVNRTEQGSGIGQSSRTVAGETLWSMNEKTTGGNLVGNVTASYWLVDGSDRDATRAADVPYGFRGAQSTLEVTVTDLVTGNILPQASSLPGTDMNLSDLAWSFEDDETDNELPLDDDEMEILSDANEGGLVDVGLVIETSVPADARHADKTPTNRETRAKESQSNVPSTSWQEAALRGEQLSETTAGNPPTIPAVPDTPQPVRIPPAVAAARSDHEGGMIESFDTEASSGTASQRPRDADAVESVFSQWPSTLSRTEIRMDAEVAVYQAFELSTSPRVPDAQTGTTVAESRDAQ